MFILYDNRDIFVNMKQQQILGINLLLFKSFSHSHILYFLPFLLDSTSRITLVFLYFSFTTICNREHIFFMLSCTDLSSFFLSFFHILITLSNAEVDIWRADSWMKFTKKNYLFIYVSMPERKQAIWRESGIVNEHIIVVNGVAKYTF